MLGQFFGLETRTCTQGHQYKVDALAAVVISLPITETIFLPIYYQPFSSITPSQVSQVEEVLPSWMDPIIHYINTEELPSEKDKAHKVQV